MTIHYGYGGRVCDTDMVRLNPDQFSILPVGFVHTSVSFALSCLQQQPQVREFCGKRSGDIPYGGIRSKVLDEVVEEQSSRNSDGGEEEVDHGHFASA